MLSKRIIARLDIKHPQGLVKGIQLEGFRKLGNPMDFARRYCEQGADELMYQDVVASLYNRNSLQDYIKETVRDCFIPVCVGGGVRTLQDAVNLLHIGADKIAVNTGAIRNPELITQISNCLGSQSTVVTLEVIKFAGRYECFINNGRDHTDLDPIQWAIKATKLGAGELILTFVDRDGKMCGMDGELIRKLTESVTVPVVAHGGVGKIAHVIDAFNAGADAVAIASCFHYNRFTITDVKRAMQDANLPVRMEE